MRSWEQLLIMDVIVDFSRHELAQVVSNQVEGTVVVGLLEDAREREVGSICSKCAGSSGVIVVKNRVRGRCLLESIEGFSCTSAKLE